MNMREGADNQGPVMEQFFFEHPPKTSEKYPGN